MTYIGTTPNYGTLHSQTITTANGSTATFTLDQYVADADSIIVTIGNVVQEPVTAYTASGNSITFTENVPNGDTIVIRYLGRQIDVPTSYTQSTRYKYVATNNQTTFSDNDANGLSLSYTVGNIDCYLNGVHLDETDFTASNGTSVVLGSGATTSDELVIVAWKTVQISNALDKTAGGTVTGATTFSGDLTVDTTTLKVDSANNRVGIGTASPDTEFHVKGAGTVMNIEGTGGSSFLGLKDSDDGTVGFIGVDGGSIKFQTSGNSYSDKLVIDANGVVTKPKQPCFRARRTNNAGTTQGFQGNLIFDSKTLDLGNNYNTSNGRFTAPVAGTYYFSHAGLGASGTSASTHSSGYSWHLEFLLNGTRTGFQFYWYQGNPSAGGNQQGYINSYMDMVITLNANDYITIQLPDGTDSYYSDTSTYYDTYFQGFLIA